MPRLRTLAACLAATALSALAGGAWAADFTLRPAQCTAAALGTQIPAAQIGEPVSGVTLDPPVWHAAAGADPAYCQVTGALLPVDRSATARPIHFAVALPAVWAGIGVQMGGGGMDGTVPQVGGAGMNGEDFMAQKMAAYGSDSGHSGSDTQWSLNAEAIKNFGYMQMKKTHDAAMVLLQRAYGAKLRLSYWVGNSQGGREGLTVVQRYPADYDGVVVSVPVVNLSNLIAAPTWTRQREIKLANWVPPVKEKAIAALFIRTCDKLDGIVDGVINNYVACRAIFNTGTGSGTRDPWKEIRCPNNKDPDPNDSSAQACVTDAQIETLKFIFSNDPFDPPLANNNTSFGMWVPTVDLAGGMGGGAPAMRAPGGAPAGGPPTGGPPAGAPPAGGPPLGMSMPKGMMLGGFFTATRYRGQQGAAPDAPVFSSTGTYLFAGFVMGDPNANPLDYTEGTGNPARRQLAAWIDSVNPDLSAFARHGGKLIVTIGTSDTLASDGSQLDYYQSVLNKVGRTSVDRFARFYVLPQTGHGLTGASYTMDGNGKSIPATPIPSTFNRFALLRDWVEKNIAPGMSITVTGAAGSRPLCSYPDYPRYIGGDETQAAAYRCTAPH